VGTRIEAMIVDITTLDVDAIVNAANSSLLGGGGVDGAIHLAAGPGLLAECKKLQEVRPRVRCPAGEARITGGHALAARHVIHTVGPVWSGGDDAEDETLARCYDSCLALAMKHSLRSIAFPAISTGVYGFPAEQAAAIAIKSVLASTEQAETIERVVFANFDDKTQAIYEQLLRDTR
jgi:O-acetyl-ADP-ribose deacetylase (regulator of RNase III)